MIRITQDQMDALALDQQARFADRVVTHLKEHFPDAAVLAPTELHAGVLKQIANAEGYGLYLEQEQAAYVTSAWLMGEDFDTRMPAAESVLSAAALTGEEKRQWLEEFTRKIFTCLEKN